jgi:rhodanese-related sulfurtransferase
MKTMSPEKLKSLLDEGRDVQIIDIRESHEVESGNLGGSHIPMAEVMDRIDEIRKDCPVVVHCKSGSRASAMVFALQSEKGLENVYNLEGGLEAWAEKIDPQITVY